LIVTPLTLRHFFQFASGFSPSPSSPSPLSCSRYHCSFLCSVRPLFGSPFGSGRDKKSFRSQYINSGGTPKFRVLKRCGQCLRAAVSAVGQPAQLYRISLSSLYRRTDLLVRRTLAGEVLHVKRAKGSPDRRANSYDAFFHVWA
jgi:hypothetical protein